MKFKIHRGTKEIGGSCVEVSTHSTRILLDFGMPLVDEYGDDFNFYPYKDLSQNELIEEGILHNINGLYPNSDNLIDGIVISHAHQDHIGLLGYVHQNIKYYLGAATHEIIKLGNVFNRKDLQLKNFFHFTKSETFNIGDISITPYWNDHSGFDAYSFLLQANGKSIFYSGDFRSHGRKASAFEWLLQHAPQNVDYLLLEGTTIGSSDEPFKTEDELEQEFATLFKNSDCINYVWTSSQNIDRLVSIYKACIASNKTFVVDVYTANVLHTLSQFAKLPTPLKDFKQIKVIFPYILTTNLYARNLDAYVNKFASSKITKETISANPSDYVVVVRPNMKVDIERITAPRGNLIYSMWDGYKKKPYTIDFLDWFTSKSFTIVDIHTSGHADTPTLKRLVAAIKPKYIVPIHTSKGENYQDIFDYPIVRLKDGEVQEV